MLYGPRREYGEKQIAVNSIFTGFCKTSYYPNFAKNNDLLNMTLEKTPMRRWERTASWWGSAGFFYLMRPDTLMEPQFQLMEAG